MSGVRSEKEQRRRERSRQNTWRVLRPVLAVVLSILIACGAVFAVGSALYRKLVLPIDRDDATPILVEIPSGAGTSQIGKLLYESGLISNKAVFKIYVDFMGKSSSLKAGSYYLSKNMDIMSMVDVICKGNPPRETIDITVTEGMSVEDIGALLVSKGVWENADKFLELCRTGEDFMDYSCISAIVQNPKEDRKYVLEGYLFPDTYTIYKDASEKSVISKMLVRFLDVFSTDYMERAAELSMSIDDVITLASLIEREAKTADFEKVSAVFHGRLREGMTLGSDAPLRYITGQNLIEFSAEQVSNPSLYNTHVHKGLPLGPITNPGQATIYAALYPDEEYLGTYFYFCLKSSQTGELVFAKTLEEHRKNIEQYKPYW